ncbi:DNA polymerase zeta catalytic subunit [Trichinella zimbabwensis]|uniref:DNA-directed DNA polymerase n=1 Tax=Trichinella zimbabwensis TaxID=268475 RepID=A0A0V1H8G4_9BILA|nr:DNA polymerase zeta catalytic subunit [Trichinella zimbabwensis]
MNCEQLNRCLFVLLRGISKEEAFAVGAEIAASITEMNPYPVKLKFEKVIFVVYYPCILQTKKRYVGYSYQSVDQMAPTFDAKGIETVRRDTCPAVSKILEKSLRILFETNDINNVRNYVCEQFQKILSGSVPLMDFIFAKEYRGKAYYRQNASVPSLHIAKRRMIRDHRAEPRIRERVRYLIVCGEPKCTLISCVKEPEEFLLNPGLRLNVIYYIVRQISPALNRCFNMLGHDALRWFERMPKRIHYSRLEQRDRLFYGRISVTGHAVDFDMNQHRFLSSCRNTSHSTTRRSPAELLLGHKLRCMLDLLKPSLEAAVEVRLFKQASYNDRKATHQEFQPDEKVLVTQPNGKQHEKHADHLRFCEADEPKEEEEVHEETPLTARSQRPADQHPKRSTKPPAHPFFRNRPRALSGLCLHKEK